MADREKRSGRRLKFPVEADVIATAVRSDSSNCMIAEALKRAIPDASHVTVDLATIRYTDRKRRERYIYLTPEDAQWALLQYDAGVTPEPFTVRANVMQITQSGAAEPRPAGKSKPRQRKRVARIERNGRAPGEVIKVGGEPPPTGAHAGGALSQAALKTGRARRFGLRRMATRGPEFGADRA